MKITAPEGYVIERTKIVDGDAVLTLKAKERELPTSWKEFCKMFPLTDTEMFVDGSSNIYKRPGHKRDHTLDRNLLPDSATAEAILVLSQLIRLRNCYNGDWVPDWTDYNQDKYTIEFYGNEIFCDIATVISAILYFKTEELRDKFLLYFHPLIEKLKPLYGIKEGGKE